MKICVVGLGYVGLPLLIALSKRYHVFGVDVSLARIDDIKSGRDVNLQCSEGDLANLSEVVFGVRPPEEKFDIFIITVPTPITDANLPDLSAVQNACEIVGEKLKGGEVVVLESTVYPGCTEDFCMPILAKVSGLKPLVDFHMAYSPERVSPGVGGATFKTVNKILGASSPEALDRLVSIYQSVIEAEVHPVSSIKVAEAAKVLENTQRDVNIALFNEFSQICDALGINTRDVISAASTKWNFVPFYPGFVGGHCIGVDPHYLRYKASIEGCSTELISAARSVNESMVSFVVRKFTRFCLERGKDIRSCRVLILGATFKPDCPDFRNSKTLDLMKMFFELGLECVAADPYASLAPTELNISELHSLESLGVQTFDVLIIVLDHSVFKELGIEWFRNLLKPDGVLFDLKQCFDPALTDFSF